MVNLTRKDADVVKSTLDCWEKEKVLTHPVVEELKATIHMLPFNWKKLAKYAIWLAIACFIISIMALVSDRMIQIFFQRLFHAPHSVKCMSFFLIAGLLYGWGFYWQKTRPEKNLINESILFIGVLATAAAVYQLGKTFDTGSDHFSILLLLSFIIYAVLGLFFQSILIWVFAIFSLGGWFGAETGYMSRWWSYNYPLAYMSRWWSYNYPLRFVLFGAVLTMLAFQMPQIPRLRHFKNSTLVMGLLYLFIALWILSIFGDYVDMDHWRSIKRSVKQIELFHWSLIFGMVALGAIVHGIKYENNITKGFGLTFIFINVYTRFFEYFWNGLHAGIFFGILAISFWWLGAKAEKIWHIEQSLKK